MHVINVMSHPGFRWLFNWLCSLTSNFTHSALFSHFLIPSMLLTNPERHQLRLSFKLPVVKESKLLNSLCVCLFKPSSPWYRSHSTLGSNSSHSGGLSLRLTPHPCSSLSSHHRPVPLTPPHPCSTFSRLEHTCLTILQHCYLTIPYIFLSLLTLPPLTPFCCPLHLI